MTTPEATMQRIDVLLSHVWMVRRFLKYADETADDEDLQQVHRTLYDCMLALGKPWKDQDAVIYLKLARKKFSKLRGACDLFTEIQPEVSGHTNYQMANRSLCAAVSEIGQLLDIQTD